MAIPASKLSVLAESFSLGKLMHKYANMRRMNFDRGKNLTGKDIRLNCLWKTCGMKSLCVENLWKMWITSEKPHNACVLLHL